MRYYASRGLTSSYRVWVWWLSSKQHLTNRAYSAQPRKHEFSRLYRLLLVLIIAVAAIPTRREKMRKLMKIGIN